MCGTPACMSIRGPRCTCPSHSGASTQMVIVARTQGTRRAGPGGAGGGREVDRDQPITEIRTMERVVSTSVAGRRFNMVLPAWRWRSR